MFNSRSDQPCQTDDHAVTPRRRAAVAAPCTNIASLAWPHHVHIADIDTFDYFQRRSSLTQVPCMCVAGARGAVRQPRAVLMDDTLSCRTSSSLRFEPVAVRARASTAPDHRFTYPNSPCGLLECRGSRAVRPHDRHAPLTSLSTRSPSTIDPKNGRKRRHHHPLAALRIFHRHLHARRSSRELAHMHV